MKYLALAALVSASLVTTAGIRGSSAPNSGEYRAKVHLLRLKIDRLTSPVAGKRLRSLRSAMFPLGRVRLPDGTEMATGILPGAFLPSSAITSARLRLLKERFDQLDDSLRSPEPGALTHRQLSTLHGILQSAEFHPQPSVWDIVGGWVGRFLTWLMSGLSGSSQPVYILGAAVLALAILVALFLIISRLRAGRFNSVLATRSRQRLTSSVAREQASALAAKGEFRQALHMLLMAVLMALREEDLLDPHPGLTNREYLLTLEGVLGSAGSTTVLSPDRLHAIKRLIVLFDDVWYGDVPVDLGLYQDAEDLTNLVLLARSSAKVA